MNYNEVSNDLNISQLIYISKPDNTISIGISHPNIHPTEHISQNDSLLKDKTLTLINYGTITNENNPLHSHSTINIYLRLRAYNIMIKTFISLLAFLITMYDYNIIKYRIRNMKSVIIRKLRYVHLYMNDVEIFQILYSFMLIYIGMVLLFIGIMYLGIIYDKAKWIKVVLHVLIFEIIYNVMEIILKENNMIILMIRMVAFVMVKLWYIIRCSIEEMLSAYPEFEEYSY